MDKYSYFLLYYILLLYLLSTVQETADVGNSGDGGGTEVLASHPKTWAFIIQKALISIKFSDSWKYFFSPQVYYIVDYISSVDLLCDVLTVSSHLPQKCHLMLLFSHLDNKNSVETAVLFKDLRYALNLCKRW